MTNIFFDYIFILGVSIIVPLYYCCDETTYSGVSLHYSVNSCTCDLPFKTVSVISIINFVLRIDFQITISRQ